MTENQTLSKTCKNMSKVIYLGNKYEISHRLCKGSFGRVFLGKNLLTDEKVVVKIVKKRDKNSRKDIDHRIMRDVEIPKIIEHPNIIQVIDFMTDHNYFYIIYPYIPFAVSLAQIKKSQFNFTDPNTMKHMIEMLCQITRAIEYMHSKMVVHRDIKPDNIIISRDLAILIDFDLAFVIDDVRFPALRSAGTPNYMAPEIWRRDDNIDYKLTDIYSFGVTLYYIFNKKKLPYKATKIEDLEYQIRNARPLKSNSGFIILDKLIMSLINKNPMKRPTMDKTRDILMKLI